MCPAQWTLRPRLHPTTTVGPVQSRATCVDPALVQGGHKLVAGSVFVVVYILSSVVGCACAAVEVGMLL